MSAENQPLGIRLISVLHYIVSGLYFLFGISSLIYPRRIATGIVLTNQLDPSLIGTISTWIIIFSIILIEGIAVLQFFIAKGLMKGKRWTRNIVVVFALINLIFWMLILIFSPQKFLGFVIAILYMLLNLTVIVYLLYNRKSRGFFSKIKSAD